MGRDYKESRRLRGCLGRYRGRERVSGGSEDKGKGREVGKKVMGTRKLGERCAAVVKRIGGKDFVRTTGLGGMPGRDRGGGEMWKR